MPVGKITQKAIYLIVILFILGGSSIPPGDNSEKVRAFTRNIEFDYINWTLNSASLKVEQSALKVNNYLADPTKKQLVLDYLNLIKLIQQKEFQLTTLYATPNLVNFESLAAPLRAELNDLYNQRTQLGPLAEAVIQQQLAITIAKYGLALGGQPLPPVLYHITPVPSALIVSPREVIRQDENISLVPDLTLEQKIKLEEQVDKSLSVSSLVEEIGGIGVYPTMVMQTSDLNWLVEVVAHEWIHNFLSLRPLGIYYLSSAELRTMNETVASIAGKELGHAMIETYYPELAPPPEPSTAVAPPPSQPPEQPEFDFRAEMHLTRITVDQLLSEKKIEEAEAFMDDQRIFFWEHGYLIRKLNQAYFAFHGAYADEAIGAAGKDPVGAAVRLFRTQNASLSSFVKRMSWMWSYQQLQLAVSDRN